MQKKTQGEKKRKKKKKRCSRHRLQHFFAARSSPSLSLSLSLSLTSRCGDLASPTFQFNKHAMSSIAVAGAVRAVRRADAKSIFFWAKLFFCLVCPPVAVTLELHSVETVSLWIIGNSFVLWMLGFLPGELR